jgi:undecaprenyl-diphosphatase
MKIQWIFVVLACGVTSSVQTNIFKELNKFNTKNKQKVAEVFDNVYAVEEGVFYRSHQLAADVLDKYIKLYGIKTVINLRGDDDKEWTRQEKVVTESNGGLFFSLSMSAVYLTTRENLIQLLTIFEAAPRPMIVHCIGGADRTGEVSALWVLDQQKKDVVEALKQLDIKYGHRKYKNSTKDFFIEKIWKGRDWAFKVYDHRQYPELCRKEDLK